MAISFKAVSAWGRPSFFLSVSAGASKSVGFAFLGFMRSCVSVLSARFPPACLSQNLFRHMSRLIPPALVLGIVPEPEQPVHVAGHYVALRRRYGREGIQVRQAYVPEVCRA